MIANEGKAVTSLLELFLRKVAETPDAVAVEAEVQKVVTKQHENALNTLPAAAASAAASDLGSKAMLKITYAELDSRARHIAAVVAVQIAAHEANASAAVAVVRDYSPPFHRDQCAHAHKVCAQSRMLFPSCTHLQVQLSSLLFAVVAHPTGGARPNQQVGP